MSSWPTVGRFRLRRGPLALEISSVIGLGETILDQLEPTPRRPSRADRHAIAMWRVLRNQRLRQPWAANEGDSRR